MSDVCGPLPPCRFPDFTLLSKTGNYTAIIDCIIITHFHLDHLGALPFFTEVSVPDSRLEAQQSGVSIAHSHQQAVPGAST